MNDTERQTRSYLMDLLKRHGINPRNEFGQNFLIDVNLVEYIAAQGRLTKKDVVLEVGTGTGGLTGFLADKAGHVISVEIDRNMHHLASSVLQDRENITLLHMDALRNKNNFSTKLLETIQLHLDEEPERRLKLVANLPYNVATPIVSNLVATDLPWSSIVVTIQLELGQRMAAKPGQSTYGALSVWLQSQARVRILKRVQPSVFWPRPKVRSAIVQMSPAPEWRKRIDNREFFHDFVRRLFQQRRKLLRGVTAGMYRKQLEKSEIDAILLDLNIPKLERAEQLLVPQLVKLSNRLNAAINDKS